MSGSANAGVRPSPCARTEDRYVTERYRKNGSFFVRVGMSLKTCFWPCWSLRFVWIAKYPAMHFALAPCEKMSVVEFCDAAIFSVTRKFRRSNILPQIIRTNSLLYYLLSGSINYVSSSNCDDCPGNSQSIWYLRQLPMQCVLWITYCPIGWHFTLLLNALSL